MNSQTFQWGKFFRSPSGVVLLVFLVVAGFYVITEHTVHVYGVLPYLLLLLCPLMHLFMHGGHGNHDEHQDHQHNEGERK